MPTMLNMFTRRAVPRKDPVQVLQDALSESAPMSLSTMTAALDTVVEGGLWQQSGSFVYFGEFAIAQPPNGLGVRSSAPLKLLRHALLGAGYVAQWTEVLERVARPRGRPRTNLVNDDDFVPFYSLPTASTSRDRLLLALKRNHPDHFAMVCSGKLSARAAAIEAGLLAVGFRRYGGACDIGAAAALTERAQGRLLCDLFNVVSANAQCALIARALEPQLGFGLAERWRTERASSSGS